MTSNAPGVVVQKRSVDILLFVAVTSTDPRFDTLYLSKLHDAQRTRRPEAHSGRGPTRPSSCARYSMRIWLRPDKMAAARHHRQPMSQAPSAPRTPSTRRQDRPGSRSGRPGADLHRDRQGRLIQRGVRQHRPRSSGPGGVLAREGHRAHRARCGQLDVLHHGGRAPTIGTAVYLKSAPTP